jgi:hypothetical protein
MAIGTLAAFEGLVRVPNSLCGAEFCRVLCFRQGLSGVSWSDEGSVLCSIDEMAATLRWLSRVRTVWSRKASRKSLGGSTSVHSQCLMMLRAIVSSV